MTAEASSHYPEIAVPEPLTQGTYNKLLTDTLELHFNAQPGEQYGHYIVRSHTLARTVMTAQLDGMSSHLIVEDTLSRGVLLRSAHTMHHETTERSVLLSNFFEQPKILEKRVPAYGLESSDRLINRLPYDGVPLSEGVAKQWIVDIAEFRSSLREARQSKIAGLMRKLNPASW